MKIKIYTYRTVSKINKQRNLILPEISIIIIRLTNLKFHLSQLKLTHTEYQATLQYCQLRASSKIRRRLFPYFLWQGLLADLNWHVFTQKTKTVNIITFLIKNYYNLPTPHIIILLNLETACIVYCQLPSEEELALIILYMGLINYISAMSSKKWWYVLIS